MSPKYLKLFGIKAYTRFFIGNSFSMVGTGIRFIAFTWLALELTQANHSVALVLLCEALPGILFSHIVGLYVDWVDRKLLLAMVNVCQALILTAIPVLAWFGYLRSWELYLVTFIVAIGEVIYKTTVVALIREVVSEEMLLLANTTNGIGNQIGISAGTLFAGLAIAWTSVVTTMVVYAICLLFGALSFWSMRKGYVAPSERIVKTKSWDAFVANLREGIGYIREHVEIIPNYMMMLTLVSTLRIINALLPPFAKDVLRVGATGFGYIESAFAIGAIFGNLTLPSLVQKYSAGWIMYAGVLGLTCSLVFFALSSGLWTAMFGYLLIGVTYQVFNLFLTRTQQSVESSYQGRVYATFTFFVQVASVVVYITMGLLSSLVSQRWLYVLQGFVLVLVAGCIAKTTWKPKNSLR